jgi:hypothetical protein
MFDLLENEEAILARHTDIAQHYVTGLLLQYIESISGGLRGDHANAGEGSLKQDLYQHQNAGLIVDEKYA